MRKNKQHLQREYDSEWRNLRLSCYEMADSLELRLICAADKWQKMANEERGVNAMVLCIDCVKKDEFIRSSALVSLNQELGRLDTTENFEQL